MTSEQFSIVMLVLSIPIGLLIAQMQQLKKMISYQANLIEAAKLNANSLQIVLNAIKTLSK